MPLLARPDGAEIHWAARGEGPTMVITPHSWALPELFEPLVRELETDHRVVLYDARGTGRSTRSGPYDMAAGAEDLAAVIEDAGGPAVVLGLADAPNRAVRVAATRPELVTAVISAGGVPIARSAVEGTESLISSQEVIDAFLAMVATDYRGAMRPLLTAANSQMTEDEVRERIDHQVEHVSQESVVGRLRAWAEDDPTDDARAVGGRLWLVFSPDTAGPWFPAPVAIDAVLRRELPEAHRVEIEDGIVTRPDLTAAVVRRITGAAPG